MNELRIPLPDSPDLVALTPKWLIDVVHNTMPDWMISTLYPYGVWIIENPLWSCLIVILTTSIVLGIMDSVKTRRFVCYLEKNPDKIARIWQDGPIVLGHQKGVDRVCVRTTDGHDYVVGWYSNAPIVEKRLYKALHDYNLKNKPLDLKYNCL